MEKLYFERRKYGQELLIDASRVDELNDVTDPLIMSFYTIMLLKKAKGVYYLDTEKIDLTDNMVLFVKPGQINKVDQADFLDGHFLFFEGDFLDEFFNDKNLIYKFAYFHAPANPSFLKVDSHNFDRFNASAAEIREEIKQLNQDSHHILRSLIYYLLVRLHQKYRERNGGAYETLLDPRILRFRRMLEQEIYSFQTVQNYADRLQISRIHLNKLCKKHFSKSPNQLIRERLLAEIKKEIKYSDDDLSQIAYKFNFSAPSHFTRFFKKMMGISPHQYRDTKSNW
ncbi:MAG: helix-turn-helix transcriptional regulator [Bacteroidota bacterium]